MDRMRERIRKNREKVATSALEHKLMDNGKFESVTVRNAKGNLVIDIDTDFMASIAEGLKVFDNDGSSKEAMEAIKREGTFARQNKLSDNEAKTILGVCYYLNKALEYDGMDFDPAVGIYLYNCSPLDADLES